MSSVAQVVSESVEHFRPKVPLIGMDWGEGMANWAEKKSGTIKIQRTGDDEVKYIDHYEVEYRTQRRPMGACRRGLPELSVADWPPWLFFGLVCRAKIVNNAEAAALRARCEAAAIALGLIKGDAQERFRIWEFGHNGWWLTKEIDAEFNGHLI